jgi:hypothetical protein
MWFEIDIEGKCPMYEEEDYWGGKLEFRFSGNNFPKRLRTFFLLFEDKCTQSHICAGIGYGSSLPSQEALIEL